MTQETPTGETPSHPDEVMYCATHPKVQTTLRCGKCETPICPKCMVMTPVGARCRTCANVRPMAMYEVKPELLLRGILAGLATALVGAAIFLFFLRAFIFFTSFIYGFVVAQAIEYASNRKRGPTMQLLGVACVLLGTFGALFLGGFLLSGGSMATGILAVMSVFRGDIFFFLFVVIAAVIVWNRLG